MKRFVLLLIVISVPALVFLDVWRAFTFQALEREVSELEKTQMSLFEENKQRIIGIEYLRSPARVGRLAEDTLGLERQEHAVIIRVDRGSVGSGAPRDRGEVERSEGESDG
jgi:hypothetical protein